MIRAEDVIAAARRQRKARSAARDRAWREAALAAYRASSERSVVLRQLEALRAADEVVDALDARERLVQS